VGGVETGVLVVLVVVVVVVVIGSPGDGLATRILGRWAPRLDPTPERVATVRRHLVRQRRLFVILAVLVVVGPTIYVWSGAVGTYQQDSVTYQVLNVLGRLSWYPLLLCMIIAIAVAELAAALDRPRSALRAASLRPRRTTDVVPRYGLALLGALVCVQLAAAAVALTRLRNPGLPAATYPESLQVRTLDVQQAPVVVWAGVIALAVATLLVVTVLRLVTTRRAALDERHDDGLDVALRGRSARMTLGLGLMAVGMLPSTAFEGLRAAANYADGAYSGSFWADSAGFVGLVCMLAGFLGWVFVANPPWPGFRAVAATAAGRDR